MNQIKSPHYLAETVLAQVTMLHNHVSEHLRARFGADMTIPKNIIRWATLCTLPMMCLSEIDNAWGTLKIFVKSFSRKRQKRFWSIKFLALSSLIQRELECHWNVQWEFLPRQKKRISWAKLKYTKNIQVLKKLSKMTYFT